MMGSKTTMTLACCVAMSLGHAAFAQQRHTPATRGSGDLDKIRKISTLIGTHVMNRANTAIADIRDLVLTPEGTIPYAILSCGGVAGIGQTYTAIPFERLKVRHDNGKWTAGLDMAAEQLKKAPTIRSENYQEMTDANWIGSADKFFRAADRAHAGANAPAETGDTQVHARPVKWVLLASKVRSAKLKNKQDQDLGQIEDLLLDRADSVEFAILARGGVLGIGEDYIPIPWDRFGITYHREDASVTITIDDSKAHLQKAPIVKGENYEQLLGPGFADQVRHYFGVTAHETSTETRRERP